jgi:hypothetical protein
VLFNQSADNVPIFDLGAIAGPGMHSYLIQDVSFGYVSSQSSANTAANCLLFSQTGYEGTLLRISFNRGSWAIKTAAGKDAPWGQTWDDLVFTSGLTGGAMDGTGSTSATPNNHWGRFLVSADNMVGPIFKQIKGYNWIWDTCEILSGTNAQWIDLQAGAHLTIGAIKMELCAYSGAPAFNSSALISAPSGFVRIGQVSIGGTSCVLGFSSGTYSIISASGGSATIDFLSTFLTVASSNFYIAGGSTGMVSINYPQRGSYAIGYSNVGSSPTSDILTVFPDKNDQIGVDQGDVDYTPAYGDKCVIRYATTLTATRAINLRADNTCFNGLRYRIISYGAVNGSNTILVKASGILKATLSSDKTFVDLEWRRNAIPHAGWVVIGSGTLP